MGCAAFSRRSRELMKIEVRDLSYQAEEKLILNHVSAAFEGSCICGIIGPNGCGKTTLLRHIYRELGTQGHVFLDERDIASYSGKEFSRKMAVMMQHQNIVETDLLVRDVVSMGRYPYKSLLAGYDQEDRKIVDQVMEKTGLTQLQGRKIASLSGGELQRVMIAKCFAQQPDIIVLDEPSNHLDVRYKVELMKLLSEFDGLVIMTLHDLNLAAAYCKTIYLMEEGRIIRTGDPEEVFDQELLQKVYQVDIRVFRSADGIYTNV